MSTTYTVYRDTEGRVKAVYLGCDTANPMEGLTRAEQATPEPIDENYITSTTIETLEEKIRRIVREELAK